MLYYSITHPEKESKHLPKGPRQREKSKTYDIYSIPLLLKPALKLCRSSTCNFHKATDSPLASPLPPSTLAHFYHWPLSPTDLCLQSLHPASTCQANFPKYHSLVLPFLLQEQKENKMKVMTQETKTSSTEKHAVMQGGCTIYWVCGPQSMLLFTAYYVVKLHKLSKSTMSLRVENGQKMGHSSDKGTHAKPGARAGEMAQRKKLLSCKLEEGHQNPSTSGCGLPRLGRWKSDPWSKLVN